MPRLTSLLTAAALAGGLTLAAATGSAAADAGLTVDETGLQIPVERPGLGAWGSVLVEWVDGPSHGQSVLTVRPGTPTQPFGDRHWVGWTQLPDAVPVGACIWRVRVETASFTDAVTRGSADACTGPRVVEVPADAWDRPALPTTQPTEPVATPDLIPVATPEPLPVATPEPIPVATPEPLPVATPEPIPQGTPTPVVTPPEPQRVPVPIPQATPTPVVTPPVPQRVPVLLPQGTPTPVVDPEPTLVDPEPTLVGTSTGALVPAAEHPEPVTPPRSDVAPAAAQASAPVPTATSPRERLASTGSDAWHAGALALAVLGAGCALVARARRVRSPHA